MSELKFDDTDDLCVRTIGVLAADMVQKANSGHPGAPMGLAAVAHVLWSKFLTATSSNSAYPNRDRFILSNGHACALQYSMLHLTGYQLSMDDLKSFRQLNSKTPGHPENFLTDGVELSTGPLGQGLAQSVGQAIASKYMSSMFPGLFDNKVYVLCGDGCMQEGVASEACSLAGHLKLNNLIVLYDDNSITIDGKTSLSFTENVGQRFESYGWRTLYVEKGNEDLDSIAAAIAEAGKTEDKPTLVLIKTLIGYGSSKADTHGVHGSPLGDAVLKEYKKKMGFNEDDCFVVSDNVYEYYKKSFVARGDAAMEEWNKKKTAFVEANPKKGKLLERLLAGKFEEGWEKSLPVFDEESKPNATRSLNGEVLNAVCGVLPEIIGGAADLTPSTKTQLKMSGDFQADTPGGRYLRFGVREFGMFAICNGIASYGMNLVPFSATFLNFITYGYGAVRLGALSHLQQIYIMTHDSVLLGEDGPTHQPVEVLPSLRACPNLLTIRPCDGNEISCAWQVMLQRKTGPSVLCLSRQKVNTNLVSKYTKSTANKGVSNGAYVVMEEEKSGAPDAIIIATGTEVELGLEAAEMLKGELSVRVVSAPCLELFEMQSLEYKKSVLKENTLVVSVEASGVYGWGRYAHVSVGIEEWGRSAPLVQIREFFGLNGKAVAEKVKEGMAKWKEQTVPLLPVLYG